MLILVSCTHGDKILSYNCNLVPRVLFLPPSRTRLVRYNCIYLLHRLFLYFFLCAKERLRDWERTKGRERELVARGVRAQGAMGRRKREKEKLLRVSSPPHDALRPSSLVNYYTFYFCAGDWGRGSMLGTYTLRSMHVLLYWRKFLHIGCFDIWLCVVLLAGHTTSESAVFWSSDIPNGACSPQIRSTSFVCEAVVSSLS